MSVMHFLWMAGVSCHDVLRQHVPWQASMRLYADTGVVVTTSRSIRNRAYQALCRAACYRLFVPRIFLG